METKDDFISVIDSIKFPNLSKKEFEKIIESIYQIKLKIQNGDLDFEGVNFNFPLITMPIVANIISKENITKEQLREEWSWVIDENKFNERMSKLKEDINKFEENINKIYNDL